MRGRVHRGRDLSGWELRLPEWDAQLRHRRGGDVFAQYVDEFVRHDVVRWVPYSYERPPDVRRNELRRDLQQRNYAHAVSARRRR
jgi:hypothetical protein